MNRWAIFTRPSGTPISSSYCTENSEEPENGRKVFVGFHWK